MQNKLHLEYNPIQMILPIDMTHLIEKEDPLVSFQEVIGGLNLKQFIKTSRKGRQDYPTEIILSLILFGFMENIRSLRQLEKACKTDIRFMYLAQGHTPSFMTFQRFIDTKLKTSIENIFTRINLFLIEKEKIDTSVLYVDGTKFEANANKFSFVWRKSIVNYQKKLYLKISKALKQIEKDYETSVKLKDSYHPSDLEPLCQLFERQIEQEGIQFVYGKGKRKHPVQRLFESLKEYQAKLEEYQKHLSICGERNSYSKTDHDATFMHGKEDYYSKTGIFKAYYNVQIGVSDEYILHMGVYPNPTDTKTWIPFFESFYQRYGFYPKTPVADAGYGSYDNYLYNLIHGMELTMKYNNFSKEGEKRFKKKLYSLKNMKHEGDTLTSMDGHVYRYSHTNENREGKYLRMIHHYVHEDWQEAYREKKIPKSITYDPVLHQFQKTAWDRLKSEAGIRLRTQRSIEVEGAFGEIKANSDYSRIQRKGQANVQTELYLVLMGYNLRKYHHKKFRVLH